MNNKGVFTKMSKRDDSILYKKIIIKKKKSDNLLLLECARVQHTE